MAPTRYLYLKQCPGTDAEPGLADGAAGPASFMLERFLRRAQNKEDLRHVALALHRLHFS